MWLTGTASVLRAACNAGTSSLDRIEAVLEREGQDLQQQQVKHAHG